MDFDKYWNYKTCFGIVKCEYQTFVCWCVSPVYIGSWIYGQMVWRSITIEMCECEVANAHLICEQEWLINVDSFGVITACSSVLLSQTSRVFYSMPRDYSAGQGE